MVVVVAVCQQRAVDWVSYEEGIVVGDESKRSWILVKKDPQRLHGVCGSWELSSSGDWELSTRLYNCHCDSQFA